MNTFGVRLLRMPPCLRQQIFLQEIAQRRTSCEFQHVQRQSFSHSARWTARSKSRKASAPAPAPAEPPMVSTGPLTETPSSARIGVNDRKAAEIIIRLMKGKQEGQRITIYRSPNHTSLYILAYLFGGSLIAGAALWSDFALKEREGKQKLHWGLKALITGEILAIVILGTVVVMTPFNLIKSISIVKGVAGSSAAPYTWEMEIRRKLPFLRADPLETTFSKVSLDRDLSGPQNFAIRSCPLEQEEGFSAKDFQDPGAPRGVVGTLQAFNSSLVNIWPILKRDTRRMMLRDQMAYVTVEGNGKFKLDLQNCILLDHGKPLFTIMNKTDQSKSWKSWFQGLVGN